MTPRENGTAAAELLAQVIGGELASDADHVVNLPSLLLSAGCEAAAVTFEEQYGLNADFQPLDCGRFAAE